MLENEEQKMNLIQLDLNFLSFHPPEKHFAVKIFKQYNLAINVQILHVKPWVGHRTCPYLQIARTQ